MKPFDVVRITKDKPHEAITKGQIGTILEVYDEKKFEVEICDSNGTTLFLGALSREFLEVVV
ncbi:hypothetical protein JOC75_000547 [Metabacillus crassostreae]|uniref:DUF4926 domain-containing protein n=1 Tax=Metabacillus crassostreae TaxID=929098 RepID=UPI00195BAAA7|nr:DUF4926 domain-containing protein [Metabacillus crassostreae]MBM7602577.1 hypothetical protein [Metabacillus crassostreae]